eukprot:TRINITY_DN2021_c0_g2_i1.p1 TRINITY_DN2021_c0_g2~~TRINITY_DN2021_c0_g2_i1.p1  ORF type:complete len:452 (-),score=93.31 TRINITY_DN2021_c0_g2_i1:430-1785(-)
MPGFIPEVLFVNDTQEGILSVYQPKINKRLTTFSQTHTNSKLFTILGDSHLICGQKTKSISHFYRFDKKKPLYRCNLPKSQYENEYITTIVSNVLGNLLIFGTNNGFIHIYDTNTGRLIKSFRAHYHSVMDLILTNDTQILITTSKDTSILLWSFNSLLVDEDPTPLHSLLDDSGVILSMKLGNDKSSSGYLYTISDRRTYSIYSLKTQKLMFKTHFSHNPTSLCISPCETFAIVGLINGEVVKVENEPNSSPIVLGQPFLTSINDISMAFTGDKFVVCSRGSSEIIYMSTLSGEIIDRFVAVQQGGINMCQFVPHSKVGYMMYVLGIHPFVSNIDQINQNLSNQIPWREIPPLKSYVYAENELTDVSFTFDQTESELEFAELFENHLRKEKHAFEEEVSEIRHGYLQHIANTEQKNQLSELMDELHEIDDEKDLWKARATLLYQRMMESQ